MATAWLIAAPPVADLAAHAYRAWLFDTEGLAVFNLQWYGGHHVPGYSLLFPPLAGLLGAREAVALAGVASAVALVWVVRDERPAAAWLLAAGATANLVAGRGPFALGLCFAALAVGHRGRLPMAAGLAALTAAASPVAGIFLGLTGTALRSPALVVPNAAVVLGLAALFPEGGAERFVASAFWPMLFLTLLAAWRLPGRWRDAALLYAGLLAVAFLFDTPMGQNAARLGVLAGPAALVLRGRGRLATVVAAGLLYLAALPAARAVLESRGDPAAAAAFHRPLLDFLAGAAQPGDRVEIALTRNHWEAAHVAPHHPLARGWERQLDVGRNGLFYGEPFDYEAWLRREGIRWVALPDAPLDFSARREARLLRRGAPYLRPAFAGGGWQVWELRGAPAPVDGPARILRTAPQRIELDVRRPGRLRLFFRGSRYWRVIEGDARVVGSERLTVDARAPGRVVLVTR